MALFLCLAAVWLEVVAQNGDFGGTWFQLILWYLPLRNSIFPFVCCIVKEQAMNAGMSTTLQKCVAPKLGIMNKFKQIINDNTDCMMTFTSLQTL